MFNDNFAVMRHAVQDSRGEIPDSEQKICQGVARLLAAKIPGKKVIIYHSPLSRARLTAEVVKSQLEQLGFAVETCAPLDWLQSRLTSHDISRVLPEDESYFTIFVTHQPEIVDFLGNFYLYPAIYNCDLFSKDFYIRRQEARAAGI